MVTHAQRQALLGQVSRSRLLALATDLNAADRTPGGEGLEQSCSKLSAGLEQAGAAEVAVEHYPIGPEHRYFGWSGERRPFTTLAELSLRLLDGREIPICRSWESPASSMGSYRSTSPEGEVFEVIDVGFGTRQIDYRSHRLPGRLALTTGHDFSAAMLEALANRHADGLLCGPGEAGGDPGRVIPRRLGDPSLFGKHRPFGFNLSWLQYSAIAGRLAAEEPVFARVRLEQIMDTGSLPVVSGLLPGSDLADERVLLCADLRPSESTLAAACLAELLRTISALIVEGSLAPPRRTVQLLAAPGPLGVVAWLARNRARLGSIKAVLCLSVSHEGVPGPLRVQAPPAGRASFLVDLVEDHLGWAPAPGLSAETSRTEVRVLPYTQGSPIAPFVDRDLGLAAAWIHAAAGTGAEQAGSAGRPDLERLIAGLAAATLDLSALVEDDVPRLICGTQSKAMRRMADRTQALRERIEIEPGQEDLSSVEGRHLLWVSEASLVEALRQEQQAIRSIGEFLSGAGQQALALAQASADLEQLGAAMLRSLQAEIAGAVSARARLSVKRRPLSPLERRAQSVQVTRALEGPLPLPSLLRDATAADREWLARNARALAEQPVGDELIQWVKDGVSVLELYDRLCLDHPHADLKLIWRYLEALASAGLLRLDETPSMITTPDRDGGEA